MSRSVLAIVLSLLTLTSGARCQGVLQAPRYAVTDLGTLPGGDHSGAYAINSAGQIVGWSASGEDNAAEAKRNGLIGNHAVLWEKSVPRDLGLLKGFPYSAARAINSKGQVVGGWEVHHIPGAGGGPAGLFQTFLWQHRQRTILDLYTITAINGSGQVVGQVSVPHLGQRHPALWAQGKTTDLGLLPGGAEGIANGINTRGQIVGWISGEAANKTNSDYRAFLYTDGKMTNLGGPAIGEGDYGVNFSQAYAINDNGQIVGTSAFRAVMWQDGKKRLLGDLGSQYYENTAYAINNKGQIVGTADGGGDQNSRAFVYISSKMYDLNGLIPADSSWVLLDARGINDKGQIVGSGTHGGKDRAFLLTPTTEQIGDK